MRRKEDLNRHTRGTLFLENIPTSHHQMDHQTTKSDEADECTIIIKILDSMEDEEARKRMMS
jgi:hypothetical protein